VADFWAITKGQPSAQNVSIHHQNLPVYDQADGGKSREPAAASHLRHQAGRTNQINVIASEANITVIPKNANFLADWSPPHRRRRRWLEDSFCSREVAVPHE